MPVFVEIAGGISISPQKMKQLIEANVVLTQPPVNKYYVKNLYVDTNGKLVVEYDDVGAGNGAADENRAILTVPPDGKYQVTNLFVDPETGKLEVEYNDVPTGG